MEHPHKEKNMDIIIKKHIGQEGLWGYLISPSDDFTQRVMTQIKRIERGRILTSRVLIVILSLLPFSIRILWDYLRGDYFTLSAMPFSSYLSASYHIFMTTSATFILFGAGAGLALYLLSKNKMLPLQRIS